MVSLSEMTSMISAMLLLLGLVFVVWKIIHKRSQKKGGDSSPKIYAKIEKPLYILHLSASAIGTIVAIIHAITAEPANLPCRISGWIVLITTHIMFIMGIIMGLKSKMRPFGSEFDAETKRARKIKWILTAIAILALFVHFLMHI